MLRAVSRVPVVAAIGARFVGQDAIIKGVTARGVFAKEKVQSSVAEYFGLGFDKAYMTHFSDKSIEDHAYGYLCAQAEVASGNKFSHSVVSEKSAFYFCEDTNAEQFNVMKNIEQYVVERKNLIPTHAVSVRSYHAAKGNAVLFTVDLVPFKNANPTKAIEAAKGPSLEIVSTDKFITKQSAEKKKDYEELLKRMHTGFTPVFKVSEVEGNQVLSVAFKSDRPAYFGLLSSVMNEIPEAKITKKSLESFSNGVQIYTGSVTGASAAQLAEKANIAGLLSYNPNTAVEKLFSAGEITAEESLYFDAMMNFAFYFTPAAESEDFTRLSAMVEKEAVGITRLKSLRATLTQEIMNENHLSEIVAENLDIAKQIYADFAKGSTPESRAPILKSINERFDRDVHTRTIMQSFLRFNEACVKHNFFKPEKAAICYRLNAKVFMPMLDYHRIPHGIFMFMAPSWRGFHVRFTDIARGGVRMIISDSRSYHNNRRSVFQENYNLAHTQLLKNKDIPEGGSKGTILINKRKLARLDAHDRLSYFRQYVDALNDLMIPNQEGVVDKLGEKEIIFLGPDENTAGHYPVIAALHAKERGFPFWKAFTTGKEPSLGGIPHDTYGMTTRSVRRCVEGLYKKLGLDETKIVKIQTGGPDGDLGSNEIIRSKEIIQAVVDGSGVLYDPEGLNRQELLRLCKKRAMVKEFDTKKLSKGGFMVKADKAHDDANGAPIVLPDGTKVSKTVEFRDKFHFNPILKCDIFVPCGGRPKSVTLENVHQFVLNHPTATGEAMLKGLVTDVKPSDLKYKYIVEGANLFITDDARIALEKVGCVLIKDAAANKGGVTSSSLEVYTSLILTPEEHDKLMCCEEGKLTDFYKNMVTDICDFVEGKATREFELIWKTQKEHPELPKTLIVDCLSRKIVDIRSFILKSNLFEDKKFVRYILDQYTPKTLKSVVPTEEIMKRVPENYQQAICSVWLASNYIYTYGIDSNEFDFYQFMKDHRAKAE